tara:strand:- start:4129 stop:5496 length:1368 start_codon:yes stop_codon:yes gene_type:complete
METNSKEESIYQKSLDLVMGLADFERDKTFPGHSSFHIERMELLLRKLGNPHRKVPTIHVAGTKGKGSTSAMISQILVHSGYKVGLYTSPHLHTVRERIKVNSELITEKSFSSLVNEIYPYANWIKDESEFGPITTFEILTAMSFLHFYAQKVDFQVVEVGLGGRLDSTNVVFPEVSVITSLSIDHEAVLGSDIKSIAKEKAGIIKKNTPVVVAPQDPEAKKVIYDISKQNMSDLYSLEEVASWNILNIEPDMQHGEIFTNQNVYEIKLPLLGSYQFENAALACVASEILNKKGFEISKQSIISGISTVNWPGRMQEFFIKNNQILVDGAHNLYSIQHLVKEVKENYCYKKVVLIFGALKGHNVDKITEELMKLDPIFIISSSRHPRALSNNEIFEKIHKYKDKQIFKEKSVSMAVNKAIQVSNSDDLILGTGSLSIVAEIIEELKGMRSEKYII